MVGQLLNGQGLLHGRGLPSLLELSRLSSVELLSRVGKVGLSPVTRECPCLRGFLPLQIAQCANFWGQRVHGPAPSLLSLALLPTPFCFQAPLTVSEDPGYPRQSLTHL